MTAISTILSIAMLPLNVFIYSRITYGDDIISTLDWEGLGISLAVVISAITLGIFSSLKFDNKGFRSFANKLGNISGLGLIIFSFLAPEGGRVKIGGRDLLFYFATPAPILLGLLVSVIISTIFKLKKPERVYVSILQNEFVEIKKIRCSFIYFLCFVALFQLSAAIKTLVLL